MSKDTITLDEWLDMGYELGYCSDPFCSTHDGIPTTRVEDEEWELGSDPCAHIVRLYDSIELKHDVEVNISDQFE